MSITDSLEHYGNIDTKGDINYFHGYGLKPVNRLPLGFVSNSRYFKQLDNYLNPLRSDNIAILNTNFAISPKYGMIVGGGDSAGNMHVYDKNYNVIKSHNLPVNVSRVMGTSESGDVLVASDDKLTVITVGGVVSRSAVMNLTTNSSVNFESIQVDSKRDIFYLVINAGGAMRIHIGKYSTLEIKTVFNDIPSNTNFSTYLVNGKYITCGNGTNNCTITSYNVNYSTYTMTLDRNVGLVPFNIINMDYNQKLLGENRATGALYALETDNYTYSAINQLSSYDKYVINDSDKNFFYGIQNQEYIFVMNRNTLDVIFKTPWNQVDNGGRPSPTQMRGKMPQCRAFHK